MDWWNILIFGVIPVLTVTFIFFAKRKLLWTAPLISSALAFVVYMIALAPITLEKLFSNNEWQGFFMLAMFMHLVVVIILTMVAYLIKYILNRKKNKF